jgi:ABC-type ATPase involved in cell division
MANDPPIILADEPTANLDKESARMIRDLLADLNAQGKSVIVMTHDEAIMAHPSAMHYVLDAGVLSKDV